MSFHEGSAYQQNYEKKTVSQVFKEAREQEMKSTTTSASKKDLLTEIQTKFFEALQKKNSWGKNEVADLYKDVQIETLKNLL